MYVQPLIMESGPGDVHLCGNCGEHRGAKTFVIHGDAIVSFCPRCAKEVIAKLQDAFAEPEPKKEKPSELPLFVKAMQRL